MGGVAAFVSLYATAAFLYPGGTRSDPGRRGFSFVENYWCDLLDATAGGGQPNPSRPVALAAMVCLAVGLSVFWWSAPMLFPEARRRSSLARTAGIGSGLITPWVGTRAHDLVVHSAVLLGVVGFVSTATALRGRGGRGLEVLGWAALAAAITNYAVWQTRIGIAAMPLIQKVAFALFLVWIASVANLLRRGSPPPMDRP